MKLKITFLSILSILFLSCSQMKISQLFYKSYEIEIVERVFETDTFIYAYFDKNIPRTYEIVTTNLGTQKNDITFDSIAQVVRDVYPNARITANDYNIQKIEFDQELGFLNIKTDIGKVRDDYFEQAINYYFQLIHEEPQNYFAFYQLALARSNYYGLFGDNEKIINFLEKSIVLNPYFEESYILKAKAHEKAGIYLGMITSDPTVNAINWHEIENAKLTIEQGLLYFPKSIQLKELAVKLNKEY